MITIKTVKLRRGHSSSIQMKEMDYVKQVIKFDSIEGMVKQHTDEPVSVTIEGCPEDVQKHLQQYEVLCKKYNHK